MNRWASPAERGLRGKICVCVCVCVYVCVRDFVLSSSRGRKTDRLKRIGGSTQYTPYRHAHARTKTWCERITHTHAHTHTHSTHTHYTLPSTHTSRTQAVHNAPRACDSLNHLACQSEEVDAHTHTHTRTDTLGVRIAAF